MSLVAALNVILAVGLVLLVVQPKGLRSIALHPKTPARIARAVVVTVRALAQAVAVSAWAVFVLYVLAGAVAEAAR